MIGETGSEIVGGGAPRSHSADDLASVVGGRVIGEGGAVVRSIAPLDRAGAHDLSFLASARYTASFESSRAGIVLISPELAAATGRARARIVVERPHDALLSLIPRFYSPPARRPGIHPTAQIGRGASLSGDVTVGPFVVIGDGARVGARAWLGAGVVLGDGVEIGEDTRVHPGVTLYPGTTLGARVEVHSGARIGSDGFGYVFREGAHRKIQHVGRCIVHDDVEIGANTTIDRGSIDDTVIGAGTKIDNLVQVGHNVRIGRLCLLMSQVGISGSAHIEDGCIVAGQAGIGGHVVIGARARIGGQAGVLGDVPSGESWSGYPARPHRDALRAQATLFKLTGLLKRLERMLAEHER